MTAIKTYAIIEKEERKKRISVSRRIELQHDG